MKLVRLRKMCLNETYSRFRVGKSLPNMFPIKSGLKHTHLKKEKRKRKKRKKKEKKKLW